MISDMSTRKDIVIQRPSSKETEHGPPSSSSTSSAKTLPNPEMSSSISKPDLSNTGDDSVTAELQKAMNAKNAEIQRLKNELQLSMGKIKGYQTLGNLFQESKQECSRYKQKNDQLALQLGNLMKRFDLGDSHYLPVAPPSDTEMNHDIGLQHLQKSSIQTFGSISHHESSEGTLIDTGAKSTGKETNEVLGEDAKLEPSKRPEFVNLELQYAAGEKKDPLTQSHEAHAFVEMGPAEKAEKWMVYNEQEAAAISPSSSGSQVKDKECGLSTGSSPSFVQINASEQSDFENEEAAMASASNQQFYKESFMASAADTLGAEIRPLCQHLDDPTYTQESKEVAADLIRMGVQAMKVAKEARVKEVLMGQMCEEINKLKLQNESMRHTINQQQNERESLIKMVRSLEAQKDSSKGDDNSASGGARNSELQSLEWVDLVQQGGTQLGGPLVGDPGSRSEMVITTEPAQERNYRLQIGILGARIQELIKIEKEWQEKYVNMEELMTRRLSSMDADNRRINYQMDVTASRALDDASHLNMELDKTKSELEIERGLRRTADEKCQTLTEQKAQLERDLETAQHLEPAYFLRSSDQQTSTASPSEAELKNQLLFLTQQVTVFKEDFDQERRDREKAKAETEEHKKNVYALTKQLQTTQQQLHSAESELANVNSENTYLKLRFQKAIGDVENMQQQVRPSSSQLQSVIHHSPVSQTAKQQSAMHFLSATQQPLGLIQTAAYPPTQHYTHHPASQIQQSPFYASPSSAYGFGMAPLAADTAMNVQTMPHSEYMRNNQAINQDKGWSCATCTYVNPDVRMTCEICTHPKREVYSNVSNIRTYRAGRNVSGTSIYQNDALNSQVSSSSYGGNMRGTSGSDVDVDRGYQN